MQFTPSQLVVVNKTFKYTRGRFIFSKKEINLMLLHTCRVGNLTTVRVLLEAGADACVYDNHPLHVALLAENTTLIQLLLCHGANPNLLTQTEKVLYGIYRPISKSLPL